MIKVFRMHRFPGEFVTLSRTVGGSRHGTIS